MDLVVSGSYMDPRCCGSSWSIDVAVTVANLPQLLTHFDRDSLTGAAQRHLMSWRSCG